MEEILSKNQDLTEYLKAKEAEEMFRQNKKVRYTRAGTKNSILRQTDTFSRTNGSPTNTKQEASPFNTSRQKKNY